MLQPWLIQLKIDKESKSPIYLQIADTIIGYIKNGTLKAGEVLPGTRKIACALKINRNTVVRAFDVLLSEGWLAASERRGSFVSDKLSTFIPMQKDKKKSTNIISSKVRRELIFFDDGLPDTTCAPINELARSYRRIFAQKAGWEMMGVTSEFGDIRFREAISKMLNHNRGMNTCAEQICITRGIQMAFYLTAQCLLQKDDIVLIENPGFKSGWETFLHAGARLIPIGLDEEGIRVDEVEEILKKYRVKAIHITPHHQYPTTVTLTLNRRLRLIELSNQYGFTIIEDDYDGDYHFGQRPIIPVSAYEGAHSYIYMGSLSMLIAPAIRIGYIYSSTEFIEKVGRLRKIIDVQGDNIMEQAILELINSGDIDRHKKRMVNYYLEKRDFFDSILAHYLGDKVNYRKPDGGLAFWLSPKNDVDICKLRKLAGKRHVGFHTSESFSYGTPIRGIRLGYGSLSYDDLECGIKILAQLIK